MRQTKKQQSHSDDLWQWADRKESSAHPQAVIREESQEFNAPPRRGIGRISSWCSSIRRKVFKS
jgi:hypothetical protein